MVTKTSILIPDAHGGAEHSVAVYDATVDQFVARLCKVAKERVKWAKREGISCYRVYDSDLPEYAMAIDIYNALTPGNQQLQKFVHVAEYAAPKSVDQTRANQRFDDALSCLPFVLDVPKENIFAKQRRQAKGGGQYAQGFENAPDGQTKRNPFVCFSQEGGHYFELDLNSYLDTGLFLDHRVTRRMVAGLSAKKRVLNLFSYTGSVSVYAAAGGAARVTTVDLSQTYLSWAKRNFALNKIDAVQHEFVRADTLQFLRDTARAKRQWDLVFVDPPTFSNSKAMGKQTWDVQRDHVALLTAIKQVCAPHATIIFSNNLRTFKPDISALEAQGIVLQDITAQTIPHDFERNPRIHKCYHIDL